jgi:hypothetical protein
MLSDMFINANPDLLSLEDGLDYLIYVPSYMIWVLRNRELDGNLNCDYTILALAEYGRAKDSENEFLNFKYRCSKSQKSQIVLFLIWCKENLKFCDNAQIQRSLKHWW